MTSARGLSAGLVAILALSFAAAAAAAEGPRLEGRVIAPSGAPMAGADVELLAEVAAPAGAAATLRGEAPAAVAATKSGSDGRYALAAPRAGVYRVRVRAKGCAPLETDAFGVAEGDVVDDARLAREATLVVEAGDGARPIAGAVVVARAARRREAAGWNVARQVVVADERGAARLSLPADGALDVRVLAPGRVAAATDDAHAGRLALRLAAALPTAVAVAAADGSPAAGAVVFDAKLRAPLAVAGREGRAELRLAPGAETELEVIGADGAKTRAKVGAASAASSSSAANADGAKREASSIAENANGAKREASSSAESANGAAREASSIAENATAADDAAATRRIALPAATHAAGRVAAADGGAPIAGALVFDDADRGNFALTDDAGSYALAGVKPGDELFVRAAGALDAWIVVKPDGAAPTAALRWAAAVEGNVAAGGAAAPGAVVVARKAAVGPCARLRLQYGPGPDAKALAGAEGAFRATSLDPRCVYEFEASFPGFAPATVAAGPFEPRATRRGLAIALERGAAIVGHVVDREGRPVGGAKLVASRLPADVRNGLPPADPRETARATSDGGGAFRLADLAAGRYTLVATRRGFAAARRVGLAVGAGRPLDVGAVTLAPGATLEGIVTSKSGGPVEGAEVLVMPSDFQEAALRRIRGDGAPDAVSDAAGRFALRDLDGTARVELMVRRGGYNTANLPGISPAGPRPLEVALAPASRVAGVVLDPDRKPLAGADVTALIERRAGGGMVAMIGRYVTRTTSDAEGRFAFEDVAPGKVELTFAAPGMQQKKIAATEVVEGKDLDGLEVVMERGAWIVGRVLGPDGAPAAGADVRPAGDDGTAARVFPRIATKSDAEGLYRLDNLAPGERDVEAAKEGTRRAVRHVALRAGENALDLQLGAGLAIEGAVVDEGGAPAPGAEVAVASAASFLPDALSTVADEAGRFRLAGLADGDYPLVARAAGYAASAPFNVHVQGQPVQGIELRLGRGGTISGAVHGLAPDRLAAAMIFAQPSGGGAPERTQPDADGAYRFEHLRFGAYVVVGQTPNGKVVNEAATISAERDAAVADLDFGGGFALTGRVVDGDVGLAGFSISASGPTSAFATADADGRFKLEGLEAGRYSVVAVREADGLAFDTPVDLSGDREVALRAPRGRVAGRVLDARDRRPVGGALVSLPSPDVATRVARGPRLAATDADGRFAIANVPAGAWRLTARAEGYAPASAAATIGDGGSADDVRILLGPRSALTLTVALATGGAPDRVTLALLDGAGRTVAGGSYSTGEGGAVSVDDAPAGSFEMVVVADGTAAAARWVVAPGGPVAVALPPRCALTIDAPTLAGREPGVTLIGEDGRPWRRLDAGLNAASRFSLTGGRAQFDDVPPGRWTVRASDASGKTVEGAVQTSPDVPAALTL